MARTPAVAAGLLCLAGFTAPAPARTLVQIRIIGYGQTAPLDVELYDNEKPETVRNFIRLIESGAYADMFFHRLAQNFVMQGGGFRLAGAGGHENVPHFGSIPNEYDVGPVRSNVRGTLAMAKVAGDPDSATSQFFINLQDNAANLDSQNGGFTVFGRIVSDPLDMLAFWNSLSPGYGIVNIGEPFSELPVNYSGTDPPAYENLIYCDITLMRVGISVLGGVATISWTSAAGLDNLVEYTETFSPPTWMPLETVPGTGGRLEVTDTVPASGRFYRVRVLPE